MDDGKNAILPVLDRPIIYIKLDQHYSNKRRVFSIV